MADPANVSRYSTATWLWKLPDDPAAVVDFVRRRAVTEVFADPSAPAVAGLVDQLARIGVATSCLGGDPHWVFDHDGAQRWCTDALRRAEFSGLHLDVEPWTLPQWRTDPLGTADAYAALVQRLADQAERLGAELDIDVAAWVFAVAPAALRRVLRACSRVTVLAYRDRARDIVDFSATARAAVRSARRRYRIGVETQPVSVEVPAHSTFGDDGGAVLAHELSALRRSLAGDSRFDGIAVHHWGSWRALQP